MSIVSVRNLTKVYNSGLVALKNVSLELYEGEILALLGPNGAGKTTLISTICGITVPTSGSITIAGHNSLTDSIKARRHVGIVPQEVTLEPFEKVIDTVRFSRGIFGQPRNDRYVDTLLEKLSLSEKRNSRIHALSGGMRRRVLIAKALSHDPHVLFLDEPTAGVDVELRKGMWETVAELKDHGVSIILTTHYIEEAEAIADRVAVINHGEIQLVESKTELMSRMGEKQLTIELAEPIVAIPDSLAGFDLFLGDDRRSISYCYDARGSRTGITGLINGLRDSGFQLTDIHTRQSTLEEIFVKLLQVE